MSLSGRSKLALQNGIADRIAANELAAAIDLNAWATTAKEIATGAAASAAFVKQLQVGDIVEVVNHTTGAVTFAAVTTVATMPVGLTVTAGDLVKCERKAPTGSKGLILPDADEGTGIGYRDSDPPNYVPADPSHQKYPTP